MNQEYDKTRDELIQEIKALKHENSFLKAFIKTTKEFKEIEMKGSK